jgi:hypothetical protein
VFSFFEFFVLKITANHLGNFQFRVCNVDGWETEATQECLNKTVLKILDSDKTSYPIKADYATVKLKLQLPANFKCDHCVLYLLFLFFFSD